MRRNYLWYQFFRYLIVRPALRCFYSDITVSGQEHLPKDNPVLFVANHQNSFLDALHLVTNTRMFIHFLARAEPFEVPVLGRFFRSINMLPVYRVRDGFNTIKKNEKTFERCYRRLKNNDGVLVFAEANHDLKRRVRPLSKGFTRIAFGAEQRFDWTLNLQIIPVGINYSRHRKSRTAVHVEFGEPIPVSKYRQLFLEDEREAAKQLKMMTADRLQKTTMHVSDLKHYPLHHLLLDELETNRQKLLTPPTVNKRVHLIEDHFDEELLQGADQLQQKAESLGIDLHDFVSPQRVGLKDILLSPLYLFSLINNALPYQLVRWVTVDYIEDHVFDASAKFLIGLFGLPFFYLTVSFILGLSGIQLSVVIGYFLLSVITAPMFVRAKDLLFENSTEKLEKEQPELYRSFGSKIERFSELRDKILNK